MHRAYLSLGSNIHPRENMRRAIALLRQMCSVRAISSVWESASVGYDGPNFYNACVLVETELSPHEIKENIIRKIETELSRVRTADKNAPRTMDIDIILYDDVIHNLEVWVEAFAIVPLAELAPDFPHPLFGEGLGESAARLMKTTWIAKVKI